jgi:cell wall-associated NlpC family hydrolase
MNVTRVYSSPSVHSRIYSRLGSGENVVIKATPLAGWDGVLLRNGRYGYVRNDALTPVLDQDGREQTVTGTIQHPRDRGPVASRSGEADAAEYALQFQGTPYKWGGNDLSAGIDCSGFVKKMFGTIGVELPRTAAEQALVGAAITRLEDLRKGDRLYFWDAKRQMIGHTGIYVGGPNYEFVHSSSGHHGVATDSLASPRWLKILVAARR